MTGEHGLLSEPAPDVDEQWATAILRDRFGVDATLRPLDSERDRNFLATRRDGGTLVLKVSNSAEDRGAIAMENAAMRHVAHVDPSLPIPRLVVTVDGADSALVAGRDGREHVARLVTALEGHVADTAAPHARFAYELGASCARLASALRGFFHPSAGREIEWDPRLCQRLRRHIPALADNAREKTITELLDGLPDLAARSSPLPAYPLHADVTLSNILVGADGAVTGLIDFGDMHHTARVCDLAISLASLLRVADDPWLSAAHFLAGYQRHIPLEPAEAELIGDLVVARLVATVLISAWRSRLHTENLDYVTGLDAGSWRMLDQVIEVGRVDFSQRLQRMCGTARAIPGQLPDASLLARRRSVLGGAVNPLFYAEPLHIVRGEGSWLFTSDGRRYLDAYNNVPVVGHAHPAVVQAIARQAALLNVSSRYLHNNVVELAERLVDSMPAGLDTCIFMNSGSEANDLAWRLARHYTGNDGALVTNWAYHGVSAATASMSSNTWRPGQQPPNVGVFEPPYDVDGRRPGAHDAAARVQSAVVSLAAAGHRPAMLIVDTMFTSPGVLPASPQFMAGLLEQIHAQGGLFVADEVQAGFGRGGANLWRFADFGIVPDFVTLGKPMGNGHPIAALVTRREIVDGFAAVDEYFSTFGGNPVSCAAGLTVLDVLEQEELPSRAASVGALLRSGVRTLATRHEQLGEVRGSGLIAGADIRPGRYSAAEVVERMRARGVLVSTTGRGGSILKIRPPLVWDPGHVEVFLDALDAALAN